VVGRKYSRYKTSRYEIWEVWKQVGMKSSRQEIA
jgi:hypothetical protein